jgi:hypothetical protein
MATKPKIDPDQVYYAVESWARADGMAVKHGQRLRGSDPRVQLHPEYFRLDGTPNDYDPLAEASAHEAKHYTERREFLQSIEYKLQEKDIATAIQDIELGTADVDPADAKRLKLTSLTIKRGDRFYRGSALVGLYPHLFDLKKLEPVTITEKLGQVVASVGRSPADND